jgi:hypothetical protein
MKEDNLTIKEEQTIEKKEKNKTDIKNLSRKLARELKNDIIECEKC